MQARSAPSRGPGLLRRSRTFRCAIPVFTVPQSSNYCLKPRQTTPTDVIKDKFAYDTPLYRAVYGADGAKGANPLKDNEAALAVRIEYMALQTERSQMIQFLGPCLSG